MNNKQDDEEQIVGQIRQIVSGGIDEKAPARVKLAAENKGMLGVARWIERNLAKYFEHLVKGDFK